MEKLQYPIGKFNAERKHTKRDVKKATKYLAKFPSLLKRLTKNLSDEDLAKVYRPEGWNVRQVVHHVADSHMNMYIRLKCALTETNPTIKGYDEALWAEMIDSTMPIDVSLNIIMGLHKRIVAIIENMTDADFSKTYYHGGYQKTYILSNVICLYGWHSEHHLEHIKIALAK